MPDREAQPRRRRRGSSSSQQHVPQPEWPYRPTERTPRGTGYRLGIPKIIGRRARWVGARLRREG
ncbi:hypothetical protein [Kitasatospora griseola]|uniref:hypothetical protein n=1 Tax=Kitasatospora griseola TaxID=2064 RepID=UPI001E346AB1|nr:hypothetical protein [Kitasatospora griseola]